MSSNRCNCQFCGKPLSFSIRLTRKTMHPECKSKQNSVTEQYRETINQLSDAMTLDGAGKSKLKSILERGKYTDDQLHSINMDLYKNLKDKCLEDLNLTEEKREYLRTLQLHFSLSDEEAETEKLDQIRYIVWIAEGNLPQIETAVRLNKNEVAHFEGEVTWCHLKTRKRRVAETRSQRVRIAKGISFKVGGTPGYSEEHQEFQEVDRGRVIVTSERLLFFGEKKNININQSKIMAVETYADAVKIQRGTVNPTYFFMRDPALFSVLLRTVMKTEA